MDESHPASGTPLLVSHVAGRLIGIVAGGVARILPMLPLWRPPTSPAPLRGFAPVLGEAMPVLSTRALLGLGEETPPSVYAHILRIAHADGLAVGLLVDRVDGFTTPARLGALDPGKTLNGCATAVFHYRQALAHLVDPARLLGVAEGEVLAGLTAEADRRKAEWMAAA